MKKPKKPERKYLTADTRKLIVDRMMRGSSRPAEIADEFGITRQHVNTLTLRHELKTGKIRASKKK